ncbi:MAG: HD domain-containing phosphohydrolase [Chloroflexota bacterium]
MRNLRRYQPNLLTTFSVVSFVLLAVLGLALAWGIQNRLEDTALRQEGDRAAGQVSIFLAPMFTAADLAGPLKPGTPRFNEIDTLIRSTMMRDHVVRIKIWGKDGTLLYSDEPQLIGQKFEVEDDLIEAFSGKVHKAVSHLDAEENKFEQGKFDRLLELYVPLRPAGSDQNLAVFEVYHDLVEVDQSNAEMRNFIWLALALGFVGLYGSLFTLVRGASRTLTRRNKENEQLYKEVSQRLAERAKAEEALRYQIEFERLVMAISTNFINLDPADIDDGIRQALHAVATFAGVDRSYVFLRTDAWSTTFNCSYEWSVGGIVPLMGVAQNMPSTSLPWLFNRLQNGELVHLPDVGALPFEAAAEKAFYSSLSNKSVIAVPMIYNKALVGFLGFDFVTDAPARSHETVMLFNIVGEIFVNALERKLAEDALRESEQRFRAVFEGTALAIGLSDLSGKIVQSNRAFQDLVGYTGDELKELRFADITCPQDIDQNVDYFRELIEGKRSYYAMEKRYLRKDGTIVWVNLLVSLLQDARGNPRYTIAMVQDITERRQAQDEIRRQFEHLGALRSIDNAITSSFDLLITLDIILGQVVQQLGVDAADVLLLNPKTGSLEYAAGRGFRSSVTARSRSGLGRGPAGRAALDRRVIAVPNLSALADTQDIQFVDGEDFLAYYAVPLIAKGKVGGVLEVFHRSPLNPPSEWLDFLETLAGQTAIAVDNALLFQDLQRYNLELSLAYDTTLEGWSHALDLRDHETEGHTQRVTDMTMRLARSMNLDEADMVHIRRGALLHDIGKMGIPDAILLKPGPLNDDEWAIMRLHPVYAFELLSPISFLHHALDIPYNHHEKWDGTGYPRGLKGEQIPLAARIFAIVDVYDALRSDRPYRRAWSEERVMAHIKSLSGTHFDPQVVQAFLQIDRTSVQRTSPELVLDILGLG